MPKKRPPGEAVPAGVEDPLSVAPTEGSLSERSFAAFFEAAPPRAAQQAKAAAWARLISHTCAHTSCSPPAGASFPTSKALSSPPGAAALHIALSSSEDALLGTALTVRRRTAAETTAAGRASSGTEKRAAATSAGLPFSLFDRLTAGGGGAAAALSASLSRFAREDSALCSDLTAPGDRADALNAELDSDSTSGARAGGSPAASKPTAARAALPPGKGSLATAGTPSNKSAG
mmetsp:Transcript_22611/g.85693  ORF Transcript_22611/g.85693 Transcript_22611/m.85693 type:complete len:233 (-) Transcript_22611:2483-3181(-)